MNPKLLAHSHMHDNYNFNATSMDPPGVKVLIHAHPKKRGSCELNDKPSWCIGPFPNHYRCAECWIPRTKSTVHSESIGFFPHNMPFYAATMKDYFHQSAADIVSILSKLPSTTVSSFSSRDNIHNYILDLATILNREDKIPNFPEICIHLFQGWEKMLTCNQ